MAVIYTHLRNAVPLVWGSLRLAPTIPCRQLIKLCKCYNYRIVAEMVVHAKAVDTRLFLSFHMV